jgi:uncharacterized membrane protein
MTGVTHGRPAYPWAWLWPGVAVLAGLTAWGLAVYPDLPARVPQHLGADGVDAWADKSVGSVFTPVFVHAGLLLLLAVTAAAVLRVRPHDELSPGETTSPFVNRPATRVQAVRTARAVLAFGTCAGLSLAVACTVMWRTGPAPDPPGRLLAAALLPAAAGTAGLLVAALRGGTARP